MRVLESGLPRKDVTRGFRERPFHYLGGGLEELFSADYFFTWCLRLDFFFTHQLEPDFFSQRIESQIIFYSHVSSQRYSHYFQGWGKIIFFATYQSKKIFQRTGWAKLFFWAKSSARLFFQKLFQPPPQIMKWSLPYSTPRLDYVTLCWWDSHGQHCEGCM